MQLFKVFVPISVLILLIIDTLLAVGSYVLVLYLFMSTEYDPQIFLWDEYGMVRILVIAAVIVLGLYFTDLYTDVRISSWVALIQQLCLVLGMGFVAQALISYGKHTWTVPKWLMIEGGSLTLISLFFWRVAFSATIWRAVGAERIIFLGKSPIVVQIAEHLVSHPELGFKPLGYLDETAVEEGQPLDIARLGSTTDLLQVVASCNPARIVVGMTERRQQIPTYDLLELKFAGGIRIEEIATMYEVTFSRVCTREIRPSQLIFSADMGPRRHIIKLKDVYSRLLALIGIVLALPLMLVVAILIKLTSRGPILIRQQRVGLQSVPFTVYKFRSMYQDAEARTGAVWAARNDPRITPLGHWLRKLRIDEIPQLYNVLRGDMSIVGPRPERPEFVKTLSEQIPYYRQRHCVMPGITGWAQINFKYGDTIEDTMVKLEYDLYYIKHLSISLDLYIMFHTAKTMLLFRGAQ